MQKPSRGGAKPSMLAVGSRDLPLDLAGQLKRGLYQLSPDGRTLARLVELPTWLSGFADGCLAQRKALLAELQGGTVEHPKEEIGESHGHVLIDASRYTTFDRPAVGVDTQILDRLASAPPTQIMFFVYRTGYRLHERWAIGWKAFFEKSQLVEADPPFMPQRMVCVKDLERRG